MFSFQTCSPCSELPANISNMDYIQGTTADKNHYNGPIVNKNNISKIRYKMYNCFCFQADQIEHQYQNCC